MNGYELYYKVKKLKSKYAVYPGGGNFDIIGLFKNSREELKKLGYDGFGDYCNCWFTLEKFSESFYGYRISVDFSECSEEGYLYLRFTKEEDLQYYAEFTNEEVELIEKEVKLYRKNVEDYNNHAYANMWEGD